MVSHSSLLRQHLSSENYTVTTLNFYVDQVLVAAVSFTLWKCCENSPSLRQAFIVPVLNFVKSGLTNCLTVPYFLRLITY